MSYRVRLYKEYLEGSNGSITVDDGAVTYENSSIPLTGIGVSQYPESIAEAMVWQLENFANINAPINPLQGQLWFDTTDSELKVNVSENGQSPFWVQVRGAGAKGEQGDPGTDGADGADGSTILSGTVDPTTEGVDGDFYLRTDTMEIFGPKSGGAWGTGTSLVGTDGQDGQDGAKGPDGDAYTITVSPNTPTNGDGIIGDIWIRV